jgi:hypothetical protein
MNKRDKVPPLLYLAISKQVEGANQLNYLSWPLNRHLWHLRLILVMKARTRGSIQIFFHVIMVLCSIVGFLISAYLRNNCENNSKPLLFSVTV